MDDHKVNHLVIQSFLEPLGYKVTLSPPLSSRVPPNADRAQVSVDILDAKLMLACRLHFGEVDIDFDMTLALALAMSPSR